MQRDEVVALIKSRLHLERDTSIDAKIVTEMKYIQQAIIISSRKG